MQRLNLAITLLLSALLVGCSTSPKKQLDAVKRGMSKSEVLALAGNPSRTSRLAGADRWSYDIRDNNKRKLETVDVYFSKGAVQYVGSEEAFQQQLEAQRTPKNSDDPQFRDL